MKTIVMIILILLVLMIGENLRELHYFQVTTYQIKSGKLKELKKTRKIVFLSDLHNCSYGKDNEELLAAIMREHPNMILIGGDMLVRADGCSYEQTLKFLSKLPEICEVYCANGNHEQKLKEYPEEYEQSYEDYKRRLVAAGIHLLENESAEVCWDDIRIKITGLEIPLSGYERFRARRVEQEEVEERIGLSDSAYQILLAHHPAYMEAYKAWGADLILSGHYHGGVAQIPGIGGVIAPDFRLFPRYSGGLYEENDAAIVVSKGLGTHSVPVRLFNPAELIVLEFGES
ncbi:metallophosphoesterase [Bariatricus sp. SGI.154]|uniref:metallophosphoesterase n=1 Tax=Bariatricus sp. SGI.154 TaxID=3420549 RepID=UPI003D06D5F4